MFAYILKRLLLMLPTLLGVLLVTFVVIQFVPGGPVEQYLAEAKAGAGYRPQAREARHLLALTDLILGQLGLLESLDREGLLEKVAQKAFGCLSPPKRSSRRGRMATDALERELEMVPAVPRTWQQQRWQQTS